MQSFANLSGKEYIQHLLNLHGKYPNIINKDIFDIASKVYGYFENVAQSIAHISDTLKENFIVKCQWTIGYNKYIPCNMSK